MTVKIKRDDLIHPIISGNKWRKLKENINNQSLATDMVATAMNQMAMTAQEVAQNTANMQINNHYKGKS